MDSRICIRVSCSTRAEGRGTAAECNSDGKVAKIADESSIRVRYARRGGCGWMVRGRGEQHTGLWSQWPEGGRSDASGRERKNCSWLNTLILQGWGRVAGRELESEGPIY